MSVVAFDFAAWALAYPAFAGLPPTLAASFFATAATMCDNTDASVITDGAPGGLRSMALGALTAHIAELFGPTGRGASPLVGRITSATEGSVTVQAEMGAATAGAAWFMQTKYGALYWQMTAQFRTMRYFPGCPRDMDPYRP